jgi:dienelactone hydrolase
MVELTLRAGLAIAAIVLLVAGAVLAGFLPVFPLPQPAGTFAVGTTARSLDGTPQIALQVWYPAQAGSSRERARYSYGEARGAGIRTRFIQNLMRTDAYVDATVAPGVFPVLVYVPAWNSTRRDNTALAQSLASRGFVVAALDDLYPEPPLDLSSKERYETSLAWAEKKLGLMTAAARRVLDALAAWNVSDPDKRFTAHLRTERSGAFGFSFGGAVAAELAREDPRVAAAIDMDGWLFGPASREGVPKPFIVFSSAGPAYFRGPGAPADQYYSQLLDREDDQRTRAGFQKYGGFLLTIAGTEHLNFSDVPYYPSIRHTGVGSIDAAGGGRLTEEYVAQFFEHWLKGKPAPLFDEPPGSAARASATDPRIRLERWPTPPR